MISAETRNLVHDPKIRNWLKQEISRIQKQRWELDEYIERERTVRRLSDLSRDRANPAYRKKPCACGVRYRSYQRTDGCAECPPRLEDLRTRDRLRKAAQRENKRLELAA